MEEKIYFQNSKGDKLCGVLAAPDESVNRPIVMMAHGFHSSRDSQKYVDLQLVFNQKGLAVFRFDFYGHGESEGRFEDITTSEAVDDVLSAASFLKSLGYTKVGLIGNSFGGTASILAAAQSELLLLALISPVSDYHEKLLIDYTHEDIKSWKAKGYMVYIDSKGDSNKLKYAFFADAEKQNAYKAAKEIKVPTLIVHGDRDESVPLEQSKKTSKLIRSCRLQIISGANHRYTNPEHFQKMIRLISDFVISHAAVD